MLFCLQQAKFKKTSQTDDRHFKKNQKYKQQTVAIT